MRPTRRDRVSVFRRALREPRVIAALVLVAFGAAVGWYGKDASTTQANRDFARCGGIRSGADCVTKRLPVSTAETKSVGTSGYSHTYSISVQTSPNSYVSLNDVSAAAARSFGGVSVAEVRFHHGRLTAIVAPDGTALKVPLAFTRRLIVSGGIAVAALLIGGGLLAWGFTRVNRSPPSPSDA